MSKLLLVALCLALVAGSLCAQTGVGQIQGTTSDSSGAVVPNASVVLENIQTDNRFQTVTNEAGLYVFPSLTPGDYRLTVTVTGMQKWEGKATLVAGQRAVINVSLEVGDPPSRLRSPAMSRRLLSTSSPTVATVVERARIEQLPLNGRSIQTLFSDCGAGPGRQHQPTQGLRLARLRHGRLSRTASTLQDRNTGAIQSRPPGLDTIQEFRVETAVSSAKLTRPASAIMITRERHQRRARLDLRNRPQQRLRRRPPAPGHLYHGAAPGAQRIRRLARRPGVSAQDLQRPRIGPSSSLPGKSFASGRQAPRPPRSGPMPCATAISAVWSIARTEWSPSTIPGRWAPAPTTSRRRTSTINFRSAASRRLPSICSA